MNKIFFLPAALLTSLACADDLEWVDTLDVCSSDGRVDTWELTSILTDESTTHYAYIALLNISAFSEALTHSSLNGAKILSHNEAHFGIGITADFGLGVTEDGTLTFCNVATGDSVPSEEGVNKWTPTHDTITLDSGLLTHNGSALAGASLTFSVGSNVAGHVTAGMAGITLLYQDGSTVSIYGTHADYRAFPYSVDSLTSLAGLVDSISVYSGSAEEVADVNNLSAAAENALSASVPEPATATLSLLALIGLAARRRRAALLAF